MYKSLVPLSVVIYVYIHIRYTYILLLMYELLFLVAVA